MLKKICDNRFFVLFLIIPFFKPGSFEYIAPIIESLFNFWRIISFLIGTIMYAIYIMHGWKKKGFDICLILWQFCTLLSTIYNGRNAKTVVVSALSLIGFCFISNVCIRVAAPAYINAIALLLFVNIMINFVLLYMYPNGLALASYYYYPVNYLGIDNAIIYTLILAIVVSMIYLSQDEHRFLASGLLLLSVLTVLKLWSATGVVATTFFFVFLLCSYRMSWQRYVNVFEYYIGILIANVLVVGFSVQTFFSNFISKVLKKDVSLSGRTNMWTQAIKLIKKNILIGYGNPADHGYITWKGKQYYTHNGILEVLIRGGLFSLIFFVLVFVFAGFQMNLYRNNKMKSVILAGCLGLMVALIPEAYITDIAVFAVVVLANNIDDIVEQGVEYQKVGRIRINFVKKV